MTWQIEFPDFPTCDMPAIPATWRDDSWRNDACPFFLATPSFGVFVDYRDEKARDWQGGPRFTVVAMESGGHVDKPSLYESSDWNQALGFIADCMEAALIKEVHAWQRAQGLPAMCAFEQISEDISDAQRAWLSDFVVRWDAMP